MNRIKLTLIAFLASFTAFLSVAQQADTLFPYPSVPEDKPTLEEKCNYLVYNFWGRCNIKQSFSSLDRLNSAFGTWASFMPYATADTVHLAIEDYIKTVQKEAPKNMLEVGQMAQNWFHCDTAQYYSDELYLPFCRAVATSKKVPNAEKARYQAQLSVLENSSVGSVVPNLTLTAPDGSTVNFNDVLASRIVLFFNDPDCIDCTIAKARLAADYSTSQLIDNGLIKVVSVYPGEATAEWREAASKYPDNWVVGACEDSDTYFDIADMPRIYWLDGRHKVLAKDVNIDNLLYLISQINSIH